MAKLARRIAGQGDDFVLGAFDAGGSLVGHAGFERGDRLKTRHAGKLIGMYVTPEHRGTGLGRMLLDELIRQVRRIEGMERLALTVTDSNVAARQLYLDAGFVSYGVEQDALKADGVYFAKNHMVLDLRGGTFSGSR